MVGTQIVVDGLIAFFNSSSILLLSFFYPSILLLSFFYPSSIFLLSFFYSTSILLLSIFYTVRLAYLHVLYLPPRRQVTTDNQFKALLLIFFPTIHLALTI